MNLSWELMTSDERKRAVELADQKYALLMSGVPHDELDKWLAKLHDRKVNQAALRAASKT
jgi:hypothetical protein